MKVKLSKTEMQMGLFKYGISKLISYSQLATIGYVMLYRQASTFLVEHVFLDESESTKEKFKSKQRNRKIYPGNTTFTK